MFNCVIDRVSRLINIVEAFKELIDETTIQCSKDGLSINSMDSSQISLCTMVLYKEAFSVLTCDKPVSIGLSIETLLKILKCPQNNSSVTLSLEDNSNKLTISFNNPRSVYNMNLMDISSELLEIPAMKHDSITIMKSQIFKKTILKFHSFLPESIDILVKHEDNENLIEFSCESDIGVAKVTFLESDDTIESIIIHDDENKSSTRKNKMCSNYLRSFTKATPLSNNVKINITNEQPMIFTYEMENGEIVYYLAPKID